MLQYQVRSVRIPPANYTLEVPIIFRSDAAEVKRHDLADYLRCGAAHLCVQDVLAAVVHPSISGQVCELVAQK